ncbi:nitroreductase family protein [Pseudomonas sp. F1_0610]|uniref:nitroreductase family protein n=1 Tax=Pseudomonas sp. F1_0610 TaxID=3114284 RepID=UPI0039C0404D
MSQSTFLQSMKKRRSIYSLGDKVNLSENQLNELIMTAVEQSPAAFNSQTSRVLVLRGAEHQKLWSITKNILKGITTPEVFAKTEEKLDNCFASGFGTVLFFEDQDVVANLQAQFPAYAENFPVWSEQHSGIAQFAVWTAFAEVDIGASLQHYNPLIDEQVKSTWNIPQSWKLRAQMPFGSIENAAAEKTFMPRSERFLLK